MHHLLITLGSHGDVHPFVGLGIRLQQRGHRVTLAANGLFQSMVQKAGLEFAELGTGEDFHAALHHPDLWHPRKGFRAVFEFGVLPMMRPTFELIRRFAAEGDLVVTAHAIAFGARIAQEKLGVPLATVHLAPCVVRSAISPPRYFATGFLNCLPAWMNRWLFRWVMDALVVDPLLAKPINAFRAELGLLPVKRIIDQWWMSPELVVGLFPDWFAPPQVDWPPQLRLTGFPLFDERTHHELAAELEDFLADGAPPVVFTFGSAMTQAADQFAASIAACQQSGRRGLLLARHSDQMPTSLPPGILHVPYAPFSELLPHCATLVHHGGIGTTAQALAAGVPQLVVPFAHDQFDNAERVKRLGCGMDLSQSKYQPRLIARALDQLIGNPAIAAQCQTIAQRMRQDDPVDIACDWIERLDNSRNFVATASSDG
jgi:UDP:flavonoid glycosyltransferase YjiC (YdhE family)